METAHLDIRPRVAQHHLSALLVHIGKGIVDVRQVLVWDLLRWELAPVYTPRC